MCHSSLPTLDFPHFHWGSIRVLVCRNRKFINTHCGFTLTCGGRRLLGCRWLRRRDILETLYPSSYRPSPRFSTMMYFHQIDFPTGGSGDRGAVECVRHSFPPGQSVQSHFRRSFGARFCQVPHYVVFRDSATSPPRSFV